MALFDRKLERSKVNVKSCKNLGYPGEGRFMDGNESNELFLFIGQVPEDEEDEYSIGIYQVSTSWSYLYNLKYSVPIGFARPLADSIQGKYFSCFTDNGLRTIWDIRARSLVVVMPEKPKVKASLNLITFSRNQSMIAILQDNTIRTYWTGSRSAIGKWPVPPDICVSHLAFVRDDSQLLVQFTDSRSGEQEQAGYILDPFSAKLLNLGKVLGSGSYVCKTSMAKETQNLYSHHNSKLDFIELDDIIYDPDSNVSYKCDQQKCDKSISILINQGSATIGANSIASASEPRFNCITEPDKKSYSGATTTFSLKDSESKQLLNIPVDILCDSVQPKVHFLSSQMLLILYYKYFIVVWRVWEKGNFTLQNVHWIQARTIQKPKEGQDGLDILGVRVLNPYILDEEMNIKICSCQRKLRFPRFRWEVKSIDDAAGQGVELGGDAVVPGPERNDCYDMVPLTRISDCSNGLGFIEGIRVAVQMYKVADITYKKEIVRYLSQHINRYPNPDDLLDCVVGKIAETWTTDNHGVCEALMTSVLNFKHSAEWIPRPDYKPGGKPEGKPGGKPEGSPLSVVLDKDDKEFRYPTLANIFIQHCLGKAEKDRIFLSPITACLPILWEKERGHRGIALDSLRRMAYIPVKDGTYLELRSREEDKYLGLLEGYVNQFDSLSILRKIFFAPIFPIFLLALLLILGAAILIGVTLLISLGIVAAIIIFIILALLTIVMAINSAYNRDFSDFHSGWVTLIDQPQNNITPKDNSVRHIFVANFDMVWSRHDSKSLSSTKNTDMTNNWIHMPLYMLCHSIVPCRRVIKRHDLSLDAFDNPAIAALIEYKWLVAEGTTNTYLT
ncbi:hypothetical protein BGX27_011357 [Mortierella sp. AM989]|nr:hypothetical protein BGX27_011357 [Mortierella sp. AM989]